jgi:hypothetical protein
MVLKFDPLFPQHEAYFLAAGRLREIIKGEGHGVSILPELKGQQIQ